MAHQRVVVIGPPRQHHGEGPVLLRLVENGPGLPFQRLVEVQQRPLALPVGRLDLLFRQAVLLLEIGADLAQPVLLVIPVEHGVVKGHLPALFRTLGAVHDQGIALQNGADVVALAAPVVRRHLHHHGHEDAVHALLRQVLHMAVGQLGGEAHRVRGHIGDALLVELPGAGVGEFRVIAQGMEERRPEGHAVPEFQSPGQADGEILLRADLLKGVVLEQQLLPLQKQVRGRPDFDGGAVHLLAPGAAVAGDKGAAAGDADDGPAAVVGAVGAGLVLLLGIVEGRQGVEADEVAGRLPVPALRLPLGQQRRADGAHLAGVGRPGDLPAQILLQGPEDRVVFEGAALHHHVLAQGVGVGDAHHLREHILDDGPAQARHDVVGAAAVFLLRDDGAVHEHRAAAAQVRRVLGPERRIGDLVHWNAQGHGEILQKGAAAGGTGLVQGDVGDDVPVQHNGLHCGRANVQSQPVGSFCHAHGHTSISVFWFHLYFYKRKRLKEKYIRENLSGTVTASALPVPRTTRVCIK